MKRIYKTGLTALPLMFAAYQVQAAHCFADVTISDGQRTVTANQIWDRRTNGKRWRQYDGSHRSECDSLGANHFNSLDLADYARLNGMCGTITAQGQSWIGTSRKRGMLGPRSVEVPCKEETTQTNADYQYATKVVCGEPKSESLNPGRYHSLVNVHNPNYQSVAIRFKFATARLGKDGAISYFSDSEIGPDGAQYFDCSAFQEIADSADFLDGFFVIESREPLDVVGYYSGGVKEITTLDVETTKERTIEDDRQWSCGNTRDALWRADGWTVNGQPAIGVTHFKTTPIFSSSSYRHDGIDGWFSTQAVLGKDQEAGDFDYQLPFCLCSSQEYPTSAVINITALRADNSVTANIDNGTPFITGQNDHLASPPGSGSQTVTTSGQHFLELASNNQGQYHAVGIGGTFELLNGHLGYCER